MTGEIRKNRLATLLCSVSVAALTFTAIAIVPNAAFAETELDAGVTDIPTIGTSTDGYIETNAAGTETTNIVGSSSLTLGTTGDTTRDAIENNSTQRVNIYDNMTDGDLTFGGRIVTSNSGDLHFYLGFGDHVDDAQTITFEDDIVEGAGAIEFHFDGAESDVITTVFDSTNATGGALDIDAAIFRNVGGSADLVTIQTTGGNTVTFNDVVSDVTALDIDTDTIFNGAVSTDTSNSGSGAVDIAADTTATFNANVTIAGAFTVNSGATAAFDGSATTIAGAASFDGDFTVGAGDTVVFNGGLTMNGSTGSGGAGDVTIGGGDVSINSTLDASAILSAGTIDMNAGTPTLNLGANIDSGDIIFDVDTFTATSNVILEIDEGFSDGAIVIVDGIDATSAFDATSGVLATDGVLASYALSYDGTDTILTATQKSATEISAALDVSDDEAQSALEASASLEGVGSETEKQSYEDALAAGGSTAANAVETAGAQSETIAGGFQVASATNGAVQDIVGGRLANARADNAGYASAESGFAAGDEAGASGEFWVRGFAGSAEADTEGTDDGFDATYGGVVVGVDFDYDAQTRLGVYASYSTSNVEGDGVGAADLDVAGYQIGLYYGRATSDYYLNVSADYTFVQNDTSRYVTATGVTASADYDAHVFSGAIEAGAPMEVAANTFVTPQLGLRATHYSADDYTETGAGAFNQTVDSDGVTEIVGLAGARLHYVHETEGMKVIPELRVAAGYDFADEEAVASVSYVGGGSAYNVTGTDIDPFRAEVGAGVALAMDDDVTLSAHYDGDLRSDYQSHTGRVELRIGF